MQRFMPDSYVPESALQLLSCAPAMTLVTLDKIVRRFGADPILDGLSLRVDEGDRIGVVGDNGAGKTTMARILAGSDEPELGQRNPRNHLRTAYGEQMPAMPANTTPVRASDAPSTTDPVVSAPRPIKPSAARPPAAMPASEARVNAATRNV